MVILSALKKKKGSVWDSCWRGLKERNNLRVNQCSSSSTPTVVQFSAMVDVHKEVLKIHHLCRAIHFVNLIPCSSAWSNGDRISYKHTPWVAFKNQRCWISLLDSSSLTSSTLKSTKWKLTKFQDISRFSFDLQVTFGLSNCCTATTQSSVCVIITLLSRKLLFWEMDQ